MTKTDRERLDEIARERDPRGLSECVELLTADFDFLFRYARIAIEAAAAQDEVEAALEQKPECLGDRFPNAWAAFLTASPYDDHKQALRLALAADDEWRRAKEPTRADIDGAWQSVLEKCREVEALEVRVAELEAAGRDCADALIEQMERAENAEALEARIAMLQSSRKHLDDAYFAMRDRAENAEEALDTAVEPRQPIYPATWLEDDCDE